MKKYTQSEFDALPRNEAGVKVCPVGDYTDVKNFGERCSFGEQCGFGEQCRCEFGVFTNMLTAGGFGRIRRTTYFFKMKDETINVRCSCFAGTLDEWAAQVRETHGESRLARSYLLLIPAVQAFFEGGTKS